MANKITAGLDMTREPPTIYVNIDNKLTHFRTASDASEFCVSLMSLCRHFMHEEPVDNPGDRQILRRKTG